MTVHQGCKPTALKPCAGVGQTCVAAASSGFYVHRVLPHGRPQFTVHAPHLGGRQPDQEVCCGGKIAVGGRRNACNACTRSATQSVVSACKRHGGCGCGSPGPDPDAEDRMHGARGRLPLCTAWRQTPHACGLRGPSLTPSPRPQPPSSITALPIDHRPAPPPVHTAAGRCCGLRPRASLLRVLPCMTVD